jgi:hypothetical protein
MYSNGKSKLIDAFELLPMWKIFSTHQIELNFIIVECR